MSILEFDRVAGISKVFKKLDYFHNCKILYTPSSQGRGRFGEQLHGSGFNCYFVLYPFLLLFFSARADKARIEH